MVAVANAVNEENSERRSEEETKLILKGSIILYYTSRSRQKKIVFSLSLSLQRSPSLPLSLPLSFCHATGNWFEEEGRGLWASIEERKGANQRRQRHHPSTP